jgi:hypothetical protein
VSSHGELRKRNGNEFIGQHVDYENMVNVRKLAIDEYNLPRVDLFKIDVEGMELEALQGAARTIERSYPAMLIEKIKADAGVLRQWLELRGYTILEAGINMLLIHGSDPMLSESRRPHSRWWSSPRPDHSRVSSGGGERSNTSPLGRLSNVMV